MDSDKKVKKYLKEYGTQQHKLHYVFYLFKK